MSSIADACLDGEIMPLIRQYRREGDISGIEGKIRCRQDHEQGFCDLIVRLADFRYQTIGIDAHGDVTLTDSGPDISGA